MFPIGFFEYLVLITSSTQNYYLSINKIIKDRYGTQQFTYARMYRGKSQGN